MAGLRLRTQLLISTLLIICALMGAMLLIVRHTVRAQIDEQVRDSVGASVRAFEGVQRQHQLQLSRTATMLAALPTLKALMTTQNAPTIQDGSTPFWRLAGSDLFLLANPAGESLGFHVAKPGLEPQIAEVDLAKSVQQEEDAAWWYADGRLYWVFIRPIAAGIGSDAKQLGLVAVGYQVDSTVADQLALVADSKIVLATEDQVIASTLSPREEIDLRQRIGRESFDPASGTRDMVLGGAAYRVASVLLHEGPPVAVQCYVLVPLRRQMIFIGELDRTILVLGVSALLVASLLLTFVSRTITRPMDNLVAGVRALAAGDYTYSIPPAAAVKWWSLGETFSRMRGELLASQRQRIETERVAALGRAASSISHDLRHYLAAVVANAEFLHEAERLKLDPDEIYEEIKTASEQMTDLLDSLRELARTNTAPFLPFPRLSIRRFGTLRRRSWRGRSCETVRS